MIEAMLEWALIFRISSLCVTRHQPSFVYCSFVCSPCSRHYISPLSALFSSSSSFFYHLFFPIPFLVLSPPAAASTSALSSPKCQARSSSSSFDKLFLSGTTHTDRSRDSRAASFSTAAVFFLFLSLSCSYLNQTSPGADRRCWRLVVGRASPNSVVPNYCSGDGSTRWRHLFSSLLLLLLLFTCLYRQLNLYLFRHFDAASLDSRTR